MLRIPKTLYDEVIAHCQREYPKEACGIFAGAREIVAQVYPMVNVEASPIGYAMDPKEQLRVMKRLREQQQEWLAVYHSHTASPAYPSPVDVSYSVSPDLSYVLVSLKDRARPEIKSYRIRDGEITPEDLQLGA